MAESELVQIAAAQAAESFARIMPGCISEGDTEEEAEEGAMVRATFRWASRA